jgi:hypothetical protein
MARFLSILIVLVTLSLFVPLVFAAVAMLHGTHLPMRSWLFPLCLIAAGAVLITILSKRQIPMQLYLFAFALWLLTAGYYWMQIFAVR